MGLEVYSLRFGAWDLPFHAYNTLLRILDCITKTNMVGLVSMMSGCIIVPCECLRQAEFSVGMCALGAFNFQASQNVVIPVEAVLQCHQKILEAV